MNPFTWLWLRWQHLKAPITPDLALAPTPMTPAGEACEPVNDQDAIHTQALVARRREVMDLLCMHANAYVHRDYGTGGYIVEHDAPVQPIDESTQLEIDRVAAER